MPLKARARCEAWALHLLTGAPHPIASPVSAAKDSGALSRRDWAGARAYAADLLLREAAAANHALTDLRSALWACLGGMDEAVRADGAGDQQLVERLGRLRTTVQSGDTATLRGEVSAAIDAIQVTLHERQSRQQAHLKKLGEQVNTLGAQLDSALREGETDPLTRLCNRRSLDLQIARTLELCRATSKPAVLLMIDADHFKDINDRFGHPAGDAVLRRLADRLAASFPRKSDLVARYGGEEFVVILRDATLSEAKPLVQRALQAVRNAPMGDVDPALRITVSIGVAGTGPRDSPGSWLDRADQALAIAKRAGRDRAVEAPQL